MRALTPATGPVAALTVSLALLSGLFGGPEPALAERVETDLLRGAAVLYRCTPASIGAGDALWVWAFGDGFYRASTNPRGRTARWTGRRAELTIPVAETMDRTVRLTARGGPRDLRVSAFWNGAPLGTQPLPRRWSELAWQVPATLQRPGTNRLELRASATVRPSADLRSLAVLIERVDIDPPLCNAPPRLVTEGRAVIPPGGLLVAPVRVQPEARLRLRAGGAPETSLEVRAPDLVESVTLTRPPGTVRTVDLGGCCLSSRAVTLLPHGRKPLRLLGAELSFDPSGRAWRRACDLLPKEALALAGLLALLGFAGGAPRASAAAPSRRAALVDTALVIGLAFALRVAFVSGYPPGLEHGFPDAWGYLTGAQRLLDGAVLFWSDVGWHNWFTWMRPPGYYLFLAGMLGPVGATLRTIAWVQAALSAASAGALSLASRALFAHPERPGSGRGPALATGLLVAFDPEAITAPTWIVSEPLFVFFLCLGLAALARVEPISTRGSTRVPARGPAGPWRPGWAAAAGAALGLATLVRSAPLYYAVGAAALIVLVHRRRGLPPAAWLMGAMALVVLPWCVRNSLLFGFPTGVDDITVQNLLQSHPDPALVPTEGLDLATEEGRVAYRRRVAAANRDHRLSRRSGSVLMGSLAGLAAHPGRTWRHTREQLAMAFAPFSIAHMGAIAGAPPSCSMALWADLATAVRRLTWGLALVGLAFEARRPKTWPVLLWLPFNLLAMVVVFHVELRYVATVVPVAALFAGAACGHLGSLTRRALGNPLGRRSKQEAAP